MNYLCAAPLSIKGLVALLALGLLAKLMNFFAIHLPLTSLSWIAPPGLC